MSRTETMRTTIVTLTLASSIAGFAATAVAQQQSHPPACAAPEAPATTLDVTTLPSIDSIGAQTSMAVFMQPSVREELRLAALRRAWSVDPAIRDYKGLQENDWDFAAGNGIPGFDEFGPDVDVQWMLAGLFSTPPRQATRAPTFSRAIYDPITFFLVSLIQRPIRDAAHD